MSAAKARKPRATGPKPAAETLPLADVRIAIAKPKLFTNDDETVTFDGARLAAVLRWVALVKPNLDAFTSPVSVALEIAGIAEQCRAMGDANLEMIPIDCNAVFCSLGDRLRDLASRINAGETVGTLESVTITRKPAAEVAR
jgi:hypothetical protein